MISGEDKSMGEPVALRVACPDRACARDIARAAIAAQLAGCAHISDIDSVYRWQGAVAEEPETLIFFKTTRACLEGLAALIRARHPYELPAITWHPIDADPETVKWLDTETGEPRN